MRVKTNEMCCMYSDDSGCIHFIKSDDDRVEKKGGKSLLDFFFKFVCSLTIVNVSPHDFEC